MDEVLYGELSVIGMKGCDDFVEQVDYYLRQWRETKNHIIKPELSRFGTGEGKCLLNSSMRGHDIYIISDVFNYGVKYEMYNESYPMSPDDHFQDLKRVIGAIEGKARRISVIMPMLYEGRQHRRTGRESLDCALALQELVHMGVSNIITFDAHDARVQNAIPLSGFDNVQPTYQMIKALLNTIKDISLAPNDIMIVAPDEGAMSRCMYYATVLGLDLGMFYKRRNYAEVKNGKNDIVEHKYLGNSVAGKDVIVVDDMISSGGSTLGIAKMLTDMGAKRIISFATFGLFTEGLDKFDEAFEKKLIYKVFTTNLIYRTPELLKKPWYVEVNMCKYVAYIIETLNRDATISELLNPNKRIKTRIAEWEQEKAAKAQKIMNQPTKEEM